MDNRETNLKIQWLLGVLIVLADIGLKVAKYLLQSGTLIVFKCVSSLLCVVSNWLRHRRGIYMCSEEFVGHTGGILHVVISPTGEYIASGGEDGFRLWSRHGKRQITVPQHDQDKGPVSAIAWLTRVGDAGETICYGTVNGWIVIVHYDPTLNTCAEILARKAEFPRLDKSGAGAVESIIWNPALSQLALCTRDRTVQVWVVNAYNLFKLTPLWGKPTGEAMIPIGLIWFEDMIIAVGHLDGAVVTYRAATGDVVHPEVISRVHTRVGNVAHRLVDRFREMHILVDNLENGIDLYVYRASSAPVERVRRFVIPNKIAQGRIRIQQMFGQNGDVIVSSSDHGIVYVRDTSDGDLVQRLHHSAEGQEGRVQAVDTHSDVHRDIIVSACRGGPTPTIKVWSREGGPVIKCDLWLGWDPKILLATLVWTVFAIFVWPSEMLSLYYAAKAVLRMMWWIVYGCRQLNPVALWMRIQFWFNKLPLLGYFISIPPPRGVIRGVIPPLPPIFTETSWCSIPPTNLVENTPWTAISSWFGYGRVVSKSLTAQERWWICAKQVWSDSMQQIGRDLPVGLTSTALSPVPLGGFGLHLNRLIRTGVVTTTGLGRRSRAEGVL